LAGWAGTWQDPAFEDELVSLPAFKPAEAKKRIRIESLENGVTSRCRALPKVSPAEEGESPSGRPSWIGSSARSTY
jgi:hypothetical protein